MFLPTAEGYVSAVYPNDNTGGNPPKYAYVSSLRDHLGNLRLSITRENNRPTVLQERHYYPFGMLHAGHGKPARELYYDTKNSKIYSRQTAAGRYKYWYQEQERQTDLDLNWDSFKYRNYDYAIGRFMSVDPLAEKYPYNSTYAFQENKLGLGRELEGLEIRMFEWLDENKQQHVTYVAYIKVVNNSSHSNEQVQQYMKNIKQTIQNLFSGKDKEGRIVQTYMVADFDKNSKYTITYEFTNEILNKDGKHEIALGEVDEVGNPEKNRAQILVPGADPNDPNSTAKLYEPQTKEDLPYTGAHEYGHMIGLTHQSKKNPSVSENGIFLEGNNLMRSSNASFNNYIINSSQLNYIYNFIKEFYREKKN